MTDRDRLIELLVATDECDGENCTLIGKDCQACLTERIADHLLANGVIVPPCKVGDYVLWNNGIEIQEKVVKGFHYVPADLGLRVVLNDCAPVVNHSAIVAFLTKEEAEEKLREREV